MINERYLRECFLSVLHLNYDFPRLSFLRVLRWTEFFYTTHVIPLFIEGTLL